MEITKNLLRAALLSALVPGAAFAQSSGNFTYSSNANNVTACTLNQNGSISGGQQCEMSCSIDNNGVSSCTTASGTCIGNAVVGIKTNSGSGNVFVVRPSAVIGLLTNVNVNSRQEGGSTGGVSSSAYAGVNLQVSVSGPGNPQVLPAYPITYDARYIQISTNLFQALATQCLAIAGGCFIAFNQSTVSAHSFDWIVRNLQSGTYTVTLNWKDSLGGSGISESLACVGPLNMTVQQNKVFSFNTISVP